MESYGSAAEVGRGPKRGKAEEDEEVAKSKVFEEDDEEGSRGGKGVSETEPLLGRLNIGEASKSDQGLAPCEENARGESRVWSKATGSTIPEPRGTVDEGLSEDEDEG